MISTSNRFHYCSCFFIDALIRIVENGCKWHSLPENEDKPVERSPLAVGRAYECDRIRRRLLRNLGTPPVASPKANRKGSWHLDKDICKRCDKLDATFPAFLNFALIFDML